MSDARPDMTFQQFSSMNRARCEAADGFHHALGSWSTSDWFLAVLGELGEAANVAKKLNRVRDGIPGNTEEPDVLRAKLRQELGDAFVYLDLLAQSLDCFIGEAAMEVFTAKSIQIGYQSGAGVAAGAARPPDELWDRVAHRYKIDQRDVDWAMLRGGHTVAASRPRPQEGDQTRCRWCEGTGVVWFYGGVVRVCTHCYQPVAASSPPTDEVDWHRRYQDESKIVDNIWAALGISTYEQAQGKDIATLVSELRQRAELAASRPRPQEGWQPIDQPPDKGVPVLVALIMDGKVQRVSDAKRNDLGYYTINGGVACHWRTHWMPLNSSLATSPPPQEPDRAKGVGSHLRQEAARLEEIDATWRMISSCWSIEDRAELERQARANGFKFGLVQAIFQIWKRCVNENPDWLRAGRSRPPADPDGSK